MLIVYITMPLPSLESMFLVNMVYPFMDNSGIVTLHFGFLGFTSFIAIMWGFNYSILLSNSFNLFLS